jgi:hypothetical protein
VGGFLGSLKHSKEEFTLRQFLGKYWFAEEIGWEH